MKRISALLFAALLLDVYKRQEEGCRRYYVMRLYPSENDAEFVGIAQDVTKERERDVYKRQGYLLQT